MIDAEVGLNVGSATRIVVVSRLFRSFLGDMTDCGMRLGCVVDSTHLLQRGQAS